MTRDEFHGLYVHRIFYEEAGTIRLQPERVFAAIQSIIQFGLQRGRNNPVLARTTWEAEEMGIMDGVPHIVFRGKPELRVGNDLSFGSHVPSEDIVCIVVPRKGESLFEAVSREVKPKREEQ